MRTLPAGMIAHQDDEVIYAGHLIELGGTTTHYWTDLPFDVSWNGHTWIHTMPFTIGQIVTDAEAIQDVTIAFDEQRQQLQGYDAAEGMADRPMRVHEVWCSAGGAAVYDVLQDIAGGDSAGIDFDETDTNATGTLSLGDSAAMNGQTGPRNEYDLSCVNGFGDARCKVVAAQTTVALAVASTGSHAVTPASMTGIVVGVPLALANADGSNAEVVIVTGVTGTTFTAVFASTKAAAWVVRGLCRRDYGTCQAYGNTPNFRGCRHALKEGTAITWGVNVTYL